MWNVPPSGWRRISAPTTCVGELRDQLAHARGGRALAAVDGEERLGHRDEILDGSKPTTAPLRRMTLY